MLHITLIILLIDIMSESVLFYQLEYLHHNYFPQYLKLVSFLIGTVAPDSVIICLCELWRSAKKQSCLQKEKSCTSVCLCILCSKAGNNLHILMPSWCTAGCFEVWAWKRKCCSTWRRQIFQNIMFSEVFLEVAPFFLRSYTTTRFDRNFSLIPEQ